MPRIVGCRADDAGQAGALLAGPATSGDAGDTPEYARVSVPYTGRYQRFRIKKKQYTQQYSHLYTKRDEQLRPVVRAAVLEKWGSGQCPWRSVVLTVQATWSNRCRRHCGPVEGVLVNKINDLTTGTAIVIGTVFKDMQLKPSVLNEFSFEVRCCLACVSRRRCGLTVELNAHTRSDPGRHQKSSTTTYRPKTRSFLRTSVAAYA